MQQLTIYLCSTTFTLSDQSRADKKYTVSQWWKIIVELLVLCEASFIFLKHESWQCYSYYPRAGSTTTLPPLDGGSEKTEQNTAGAVWRKITANHFLPGFYVSPKMADTCGQVVLGSGLTVLSHPLMYIKVLIQVKHTGVSRQPGSRGRFARLRPIYSVTQFKVQQSEGERC